MGLHRPGAGAGSQVSADVVESRVDAGKRISDSDRIPWVVPQGPVDVDFILSDVFPVDDYHERRRLHFRRRADFLVIFRRGISAFVFALVSLDAATSFAVDAVPESILPLGISDSPFAPRDRK